MLTSDVAGTVVAIPSRTTTTGMVEYRGASGAIPAYLARPSGDGAWPAVVVIHDRFAKDLVAAVNHLKTLPYVKADRIGCVGFCFGGGLSIRLACDVGVEACVVFYGENPSPIERVRDIAGPVLGLYGAEDTRINADLDKLVKAMAEYKKDFEMRIYPGAPHAFFNDRNPTTYREAAAHYELPDLADVEGLDSVLETGHVGLRDPGDLRLPGCGRYCELGSDREEVVLNLQQEIANSLLLPRREDEADHRVQLIDRAHRLHPRIVLRDAVRTQESRLSGVPAAGGEVCHQPPHRSAAFRFGARGERLGWRMWGGIFRPSTERRAGRV